MTCQLGNIRASVHAINVWVGGITHSDMYFLYKSFVFRALCHPDNVYLNADDECKSLETE